MVSNLYASRGIRRQKYFLCSLALNCIIKWSPCSLACVKTLSIVQEKQSGGECKYAEGETRICVGGSCPSNPRNIFFIDLFHRLYN